MLYYLQVTPKTSGGNESGEEPQQQQSSYPFIIMLVMFFLIFWFILIRPQRKQQKQREEMIGNVKKNDHVLTSGGIYGIVQSVKDNDVVLKIDEQGNMKVKFAKSAIVGVIKEAGQSEDSPADKQ